MGNYYFALPYEWWDQINNVSKHDVHIAYTLLSDLVGLQRSPNVPSVIMQLDPATINDKDKFIAIVMAQGIFMEKRTKIMQRLHK